jgi:DNA-binding NarL/FixJ family response regulator
VASSPGTVPDHSLRPMGVIDGLVRKVCQFIDARIEVATAEALARVRADLGVRVGNPAWRRGVRHGTSSTSGEHRPVPPSFAALTAREQEVVRAILSGHSTNETAASLGVAPATVRVLLARAAGRLGLRSRTALIRRYR